MKTEYDQLIKESLLSRRILGIFLWRPQLKFQIKAN